MVNKVRWFEAAFWVLLAILTGFIMAAAACCVALLVLYSDSKLSGACKVALVLTSLIVFVAAWAFNGMSRRNYRTCRRLIEVYAYKEWLLCKLEVLQTKSTSIVNQSILESGKNIDECPNKIASSRQPVIAMRSDYKLFEMLIENLADDPSKRLFA